MKSFGFWVLFLVAFLSVISQSNSVPDSAFTSHQVMSAMNRGGAVAVIANRKLKERSYDTSAATNKGDLGSINQEDYPRFDPSPSSKAAINSRPIEHGTPFMPYVPRPTPPAHPGHGSP